jgi:hypothetical protein
MLRYLIAALALTGGSLAAKAARPEIAGTCQFDQLNTTWTGNTKTVNGVIWYEMKCIQGHTNWATTPG